MCVGHFTAASHLIQLHVTVTASNLKVSMLPEIKHDIM